MDIPQIGAFSPRPKIDERLPEFAAPFTQNARLLKLELFGDGALTGPLPAQQARGEEALSTPYRIDVTCQSPESGIELKRLLGLPAQIGILTARAGGLDTAGGQEEVLRCGIVSKAEELGADGGLARYRLRIEPPFALLRYRRTSRVFQDISVPDIVRTILDEHLADNPAFRKTFAHRFDLSGNYPPRSYCLQYRETELDFIHRLLAEEGIAYRFEHTGGETDAEEPQMPLVTFVAFDDPYRLPQAAQAEIRFHRAEATEAEDSLTEWTSQRQIGPGSVSLMAFDYKPAANSAGQRDTETDQGKGNVIESSLEDYDPQTLYYASREEGLDRYARLRQQAHDRNKKSFFGAGTVRELRAGEWFQLTGHPNFDPLAPEDAEFVVTRLTFTVINNLPKDAEGRRKGDPPEQPYAIEIEAQRRGIPLAPGFAHGKHAKPAAQGTQTALVVGPESEEVFTDEMGRIKIQFHWQRQKEHPEHGARYDERSSCWVRVATPIAGAGWGHQFIPRIGQEVVVGFLEDDIDRPLVTGVAYNGRNPPPWFSGAGHLPANKTLSGIKSKEHHGEQYNELVFDDTPEEVRTKLSSEHGKTQFNQGFLTHPRTDGVAEPRGEGFELRTDRHGAIRAGEGLLISTESKPLAQGGQLDRESAQVQLDSARKTAEELSSTAQGQQADPTETGPETLDEEGQPQQEADAGHLDHLTEASRAWEANTNTDPEGHTAGEQPGKRAILLMSGQDGIGLVTPQEMALAAGRNLDTVSHRDTQQTSARRWIHNAGNKISLFVHGIADKVNLKLIAAKGHVIFWAQSGDVDITAEQNVRVYANRGKLQAVAREELIVNCGGAYIRLKGGNIEIHAPGNVNFKAASYNYGGPASLTPDNPSFPESTLTLPLTLNIPRTPDGTGGGGWNRMPYEVHADGALRKKGVIGEGGRILIEDHNPAIQKYEVRLANGMVFNVPVVTQYRNAEQGEASQRGFHKLEGKAVEAKAVPPRKSQREDFARPDPTFDDDASEP